MNRRCSLAIFFGALLAWASVVRGQRVQSDSLELWRIVNDSCNVALPVRPWKCRAVSESADVLKADSDRWEVLLIPRRRITGIEDPAILETGAPNYWAMAWAARQYVDQLLGVTLDRTQVGLAINSTYSRSQNQLHIHVDCVRKEVAALLAVYSDSLSDTWTPAPFLIGRIRYAAVRLRSADLRNMDPFLMLSESITPGQPDMSRRTLIVIGAKFKNDSGFVLLADSVNSIPDNKARGERLLDHQCGITQKHSLSNTNEGG